MIEACTRRKTRLLLLYVAAPGHDAEEARAILLPVARRVNQALDRAGYRLCPGDIMAGNPQWCLSLDEWRTRFARWIDSGSPAWPTPDGSAMAGRPAELQGAQK